ncbi:MAG: AmmeMemoRadiSam system protein B [Chloroflexota bacterium]
MSEWSSDPGLVRRPSVAGSFYPGDPRRLTGTVGALFAAAARLPGVERDVEAARGVPAAVLVPHAGLAYSGVTAAAAWLAIGTERGGPPGTVVILGTNHVAGWLVGVGAWASGAWVTPAGEIAVDEALAAAIVGLGGAFEVDHDAHRGEHSIEVQLPLLTTIAPAARIVPLAVSAGTGDSAIEAGERLGGLLADRRAAGERIVLVISTDMAHYPPAAACERITAELLPSILACDPGRLAAEEDAIRRAGLPGVACGMCGIEPAVLGIAAARSMGATAVTVLATATSADTGGSPGRTVGYLATRFDVPTA